ncbi:nucleotidyltransferase family protein [Flavobacteriaceae bacterium S0825]|uniref:nucleotidyltransferase family protein n=1 Tax=Gaetbulibacter sp. S0825 TaxID=2720084 RepID=UPI001430E17C|nr:nucleotidyltransferase family protein [Gaetbulibacter sp. S0825]MCK0108386.1 nucleotidyltransferase family protein [Flavobacteriaceae bacterium S0825]NIX64022.1 nucleotidyltransferase family protein [Gaetbulibacter sp. S0825]
MSKPKNIITLVMAAGSSSRMGAPKQLLPWKEVTLIEGVITKVLHLNTFKAIVVLGANEDKIVPKITSYPIEIIHNLEWEKGLGNSIAFGIHHIKKNYDVGGVFVTLADQPLIEATYLKVMIDLFETDKNQIIATKYQNGKLGVPALFDKSYLLELSSIDGDKGAKSILEKYANSVITTQIDTNVFDVDTDEDYKRLKKL